MIMKKFMQFVIAVCQLINLVACTTKAPITPPATLRIVSESTNIDSGLFSQSMCKPPCWQNLTPGLSSAEDLDQFVKSLESHGWRELVYRRKQSECLWRRIVVLDNSRLVDFYLVDEKLTFINQSVTPPEITLQQVVFQYGSPQYFQSVISIGHEVDVYAVEVYYPNLGMAFVISPPSGDLNQILPDMPIRSIQYFPVGDMKSYLTGKYACDFGYDIAANMADDEIAKYVQEWLGFGEVKVIPRQ